MAKDGYDLQIRQQETGDNRPMAYEIGTKVFGNWQIIKEIGHGAYGHVYEIQKTEFGITARSALKVIQIPTSESEVEEALNDGMDEQSVTQYFRGIVEDFVREIAVMTDLSGSTNIVGYQDHKVIEHTDRIGWDILIRMELLESLVRYQLREGSFSEEQIISLGMNIASALSICHKKGIIHRDIKPGNIFVNITGNFKLGDFGVARALEKTTGGLSKKGTESYMAPEIYRGKAYGKTVDIYSLGIVLYKCANRNRLPFYPTDRTMVSYEQREEAMIRRMGGEPLPALYGVSPDLEMIIQKCCQYDPQKRWQTAEELISALDNLKPCRETKDASKAAVNNAFHMEEDYQEGSFPDNNDETIGSNDSPLTEEDTDDKQEETTPVTPFNKEPEAVYSDPEPGSGNLNEDRQWSPKGNEAEKQENGKGKVTECDNTVGAHELGEEAVFVHSEEKTGAESDLENLERLDTERYLEQVSDEENERTSESDKKWEPGLIFSLLICFLILFCVAIMLMIIG